MMDLYREIEIPTMFALHDMEVRGIHVDSKALKEYGDQLVGRIEELQESIYKEAGEEFNINSPKQLGVVLFEHMKLERCRKRQDWIFHQCGSVRKDRTSLSDHIDDLRIQTVDEIKINVCRWISKFYSG